MPTLTEEAADRYPMFEKWMRQDFVTGIVGLLFLGSLLLPRPLMFYLARSTMAKGSAEAAVRFESHWLKPRFVWEYVHHDVGLGIGIGFRSRPAILDGLYLAG